MVSISAALIAAMVALSSVLTTPCNWNAWRVVMRSVPLAWRRAISSSASHCAGVQTPPPQAAFDAAPQSGVAPLVVQFNDLSTGEVSAWAWDFGDGSSSREANPLHGFPIPGAYPVSLTVTGPGGTDTLTLADPISVLEPAPQAAFTADPVSALVTLGAAKPAALLLGEIRPLDRLETIHALRAHPVTRDTPVVVMGGAPHANDQPAVAHGDVAAIQDALSKLLSGTLS